MMKFLNKDDCVTKIIQYYYRYLNDTRYREEKKLNTLEDICRYRIRCFVKREDIEKLDINNIVIYEKFKTALIPCKQVQLEIATARTETYDLDSRKPTIEPTSIDKDLSRRDFTMNSIAIAIGENDEFSQLIDPFGGENDIRKKCIKIRMTWPF